MPDMMKAAKLVATGTVTGLALNGQAEDLIEMKLNGPKGDAHASTTYDATVPGYKGDGFALGRHGENADPRWVGVDSPIVTNHRKWTAVSQEEMGWLAAAVGMGTFPVGGVLETFMIDGISSFSAIPVGYELAFFRHGTQTCRLLVREPNTPCANAARAVYRAWKGSPDAIPSAAFVKTFKEQLGLTRGLMGDVVLPGDIQTGDEVRVFTPKRHPASDIWDKAS